MINYMKLFSMSCTIYSNVCLLEPVIIYICTPIGLFATTLHYGGPNKFYVYFVQHGQNRFHNTITAEISRFMDEDVHRIAYVVCLGQCGWVQLFGILTAVWHKLPYVWQWSSKTSWQRAYAATLQRDNDVILLWRQSSLTRSWDARQTY